MPPDLVQQSPIADAQQSCRPLPVPSGLVQRAADCVHLCFVAEDAQRPLRHRAHLASSYVYATSLFRFHFHWIHFCVPIAGAEAATAALGLNLDRTWF
jgi:hypothetical protein